MVLVLVLVWDIVYSGLRLERVQIENFGYYDCFGRNELGLFSDFIYLDIEERPMEAAFRARQRDEGQNDGQEHEEEEERDEENQDDGEHGQEEEQKDEGFEEID